MFAGHRQTSVETNSMPKQHVGDIFRQGFQRLTGFPLPRSRTHSLWLNGKHRPKAVLKQFLEIQHKNHKRGSSINVSLAVVVIQAQGYHVLLASIKFSVTHTKAVFPLQEKVDVHN